MTATRRMEQVIAQFGDMCCPLAAQAAPLLALRCRVSSPRGEDLGRRAQGPGEGSGAAVGLQPASAGATSLLLGRVRPAPQRARVGAPGMELQHLVVQLADRGGGLIEPVEVAEET